MSNDRSNRSLRDCRQINLDSDADVRYWTMRFGVSELQLCGAVDIAGVMADEVERFLIQWSQPAATSNGLDHPRY
jgi:hypothetical protein